jgi:hypothetical protein
MAEDAVQTAGQAGVDLRRRAGVVLEDRGDRRGGALAAEREPARGPFEEHDPEGEDVRAMVEGLAPELLGGHIGDRPDETRVEGGRRVVVHDDFLGDGGEDAGQAEVEDLERSRRVDHDVPGFEVAVDDAAGVGGGDGVGQGQGDFEKTVERGHGLGFPFEKRPPLGVAGELFGQELDRHVPVEPDVAGLPDDTHPPFAEFLLEAVVPEDEAFLRCHGCFSPYDTTGRARRLSISFR